MTPTTRRRAAHRFVAPFAAALALAGVTACDGGAGVIGRTSPSWTSSSEGWESDWSTPHPRPGEPVTGRLDFEEQALALGTRDVLAEPVPDHPGWTRLTLRRRTGPMPVTGTKDYPSFDFRDKAEYYPARTSSAPSDPERLEGPKGASETVRFDQDGDTVICVTFSAAGDGLVTNSRLDYAFVAPQAESAALTTYVHGLAVTDPRSHTSHDGPRVAVDLAYLGTECGNDEVALARCPSGETPRRRDENWGPGYDLSTFQKSGTTPQGYEYDVHHVQYTQCTNECRQLPAVQLWVRVPANARGTHPELYLLWTEDTDDASYLERYAHTLHVRP